MPPANSKMICPIMKKKKLRRNSNSKKLKSLGKRWKYLINASFINHTVS
jgi:hypothetical protein